MRIARTFVGLAPFLHASLVPTPAQAATEPSEIAESEPPAIARTEPAPKPAPKRTPDVWIVPGVLFSGMSIDPGANGKKLVRGVGGQLSVLSVHKQEAESMGVFGQASSEDGRYLRWAAGVETTSLHNLFRLALGYDARAAHDEFARTHGVHAAMGVDLMLVGFGLRTSLPVAKSGGGEKQSLEIGVELTVKIPIGDYRRL